MKPKKDDVSVKRQQAADAIKDADNIRSSIDASKVDKDAAIAKKFGLGDSPSKDFSGKAYKSGGSVKASRGDGIAQRGKTRGRIC